MSQDRAMLSFCMTTLHATAHIPDSSMCWGIGLGGGGGKNAWDEGGFHSTHLPSTKKHSCGSATDSKACF